MTEKRRRRVETEETPAKQVAKEQEESATNKEVESASTKEAVEEEQETGGALPDKRQGKADDAK